MYIDWRTRPTKGGDSHARTQTSRCHKLATPTDRLAHPPTHPPACCRRAARWTSAACTWKKTGIGANSQAFILLRHGAPRSLMVDSRAVSSRARDAVAAAAPPHEHQLNTTAPQRPPTPTPMSHCERERGGGRVSVNETYYGDHTSTHSPTYPHSLTHPPALHTHHPPTLATCSRPAASPGPPIGRASGPPGQRC